MAPGGGVVLRRARLFSKRSSRGAVYSAPYIRHSVDSADETPPCTATVPASCRSVHVRETDPMDARRPIYFGKIQIWNGWYSRLESKLRRLTPFLELVCACAHSAPPVLDELPSRRVARHHPVFASEVLASRWSPCHPPEDGAVTATSFVL